MNHLKAVTAIYLERLCHIDAPFGLKGVDLNSLKMPHHEQPMPYVQYKP